MSETLEQAYRLLLESRERKGLETYGETLDTSKVDMKDYLIDEMADALMYAAKIIRDFRSLKAAQLPPATLMENLGRYFGLQPGESLVVEAIRMSGERRRIL